MPKQLDSPKAERKPTNGWLVSLCFEPSQPLVGEVGKTTHESQEQSPTLSRQQRMRILKGSELITKGLLATHLSPGV